jgi:hypothetical protein
MTKYELSLSPDYVPHWNLQDALRELFQNAIDQETQYMENEFSFSYRDNTLGICNRTSHLDPATLLLGATSKANDKTTVGKFGEGYKIAALVLTRLGKTLRIYNGSETWAFRFSRSRKYNSTILVCEVSVNAWSNLCRKPDANLIMLVDGITPEEFEELGSMNLHVVPQKQALFSEKGSVLLDPDHAGKVFVNGLFVVDTKLQSSFGKPYHCGYNIKPAFLKLDRDRKLVSDWDLKWLASSIWAEVLVAVKSGTTTESTFLQLVSAGAPDVGTLQYHLSADSSSTTRAAETFYTTFTATHGENSVPVTDQSEAQQATECGLKPIFVSAPEQALMSHSSRYLQVPERKSVKARLQEWIDGVRLSLHHDAVEEFNEILEDL